MSTQESEVSGALRNMADLLEPFETDDTDFSVTTATPVSGDLVDGDGVAVELGLEVPLLDDRVRDTEATTVDLTPGGVRLRSDGSLHVELQLTAGATPESREDERQPAEPGSESECAERSSESTTDEGSTSRASPEPSATDEKPDEGDAESEGRKSGDGPRLAEVDAETQSPDDADDLPAYRDPERLREAYETHDTFTEMTEALGVDVTPQTVRRYMIKHDIHEPSSNTCSDSINTLLEADPESFPLTTDGQNGDGDGEGQQSDSDDREAEADLSPDDSGPDQPDAVRKDDIQEERPSTPESDGGADPTRDADRESSSTDSENGGRRDSTVERDVAELVDSGAVDLPDDITLDDVKEVVRDAKTLYEAHQQLGLDRDRTRKLLQELNLLDLVQTRISTAEYREQTLEEINQRIYAKASSERA